MRPNMRPNMRKDKLTQKTNIYMPSEAVIKEVTPLTGDVNLYTLRTKEALKAKPGQFFMVSVFGYGEVPISVTSSMDEPIKLCIRKVGYVTAAIHKMKAGEKIGIRGPYGNGFPLNISKKKKDVILMAGGLGIAPIRPLIYEIIKNRKNYRNVFLIYGSKTPNDIIYKSETGVWAKSMKVILTVDCKNREWTGKVGVVTKHLDKVDADFPDATSYICGPHLMIEAVLKALSEKGIPPERIITTLEAHMKCGVGKCGHCYMGAKYICTDGPVFSMKELTGVQPK